MTNNNRSLEQLAWAIQASVGQFKLILARCNYLQQRDRLIARLQEISAVNISVLTLKPSQRTLYTAIREEFGGNVQALMIVGLEKLQDLPQMLTSANQVREEFRKSFSFPIVLWVNDDIHQLLMQIAPDLESWATTKNFDITIDEITNFIVNTAAQLFDDILDINLEIITEIKSACQTLQNQGQDLAPELKANCDFLLGLVAYINKNLDGAISYYNQSLDYWQTNNNFERQAKILTQITICYYEKYRETERNLPPSRKQEQAEQIFSATGTNHEAGDIAFASVTVPTETQVVNRETIKNYLQQSIAAFEAAQRPDLIANSLDKVGIVLRYLQDWQQLKTLATQALIIHEANNNSIKISQDNGFLAEIALAENDWQQAKELSQKALTYLTTENQPDSQELSQVNITNHRQELLLILAQAQHNLDETPTAINNLAAARKLGITDNDPQLYLRILEKLQQLYFQQKQYLEAFNAKQEARSIEQQFGLRAFVGAGRLQATKQLDTQVLTAVTANNQDNIAPEIAASGRQLDVERVIERIGRPDYKLIVIHGQSGVGKSSLVNAGLIPALKQKAIGVQDNLVVAIRVYTNWLEELARELLGSVGGEGDEEDEEDEGDEGELRRESLSYEGDNSSFLLDGSSSEGDNSSLGHENSSSEPENSTFLLDAPSSEQDRSSSEGDNSTFLLDTPSSEQDIPSSEGDNSTVLLKTSTSEHDNSSLEPENSNPEQKNSTFSLNTPPSPLSPSSSSSPSSPPSLALITKLRENAQRNLRTVLIFDQFEEFFFVYPEPKQRRQFFEFLGECLNILSVKVILSLRIDYLHYLLECNRLGSLKIIGNDILSNNVLYELGNFSPDDTKSIIQRLTQNTSFYLEPVLIEQLVQDLAGEMGEVRPIELQVVGAQLQTENIRTLAKYQELGGNAKEELVKRYLAEVVDDCGAENQQAAELLLYLLTDDKGTRPLKTRVEIERDLQQYFSFSEDQLEEIPPTPLKKGGYISLAFPKRGNNIITPSTPLLRGSTQAGGSNHQVLNASRLNLILEIFVKSGLVVLLPEKPADRYQLVHDYLAAFIRQQQEPKLKQVMAELEEERKQRKISDAKLNSFLKRALMGSVAAGLVLAGLAVTAWDAARRAEEQKKQAAISEINALNNSSDTFFVSKQNFDALIEALKAGEKLKLIAGETKDSFTKMRTVAALRQAVYFQPKEQKENQVIEINTFEGHSSAVYSVAFSRDGQRLASSSDDNTIKIWDIATGKAIATLTGHSSSVRSVAFSPDGQKLASGSLDKTITIWDIATGKAIATLTGHSSSVISVAFSPDGQKLASGSFDNTIKIWDIATGKAIATLTGHSSSVRSVAFSPDGQKLASGSFDNTIKIWDIATGKAIATLTGHSSSVRSVAFSPDGQKLASGSFDNTIKIWDIATGKAIATLTGHSSSVRSVAFSPDGQKLASGSDGNTIKIWDIATGKAIATLTGHSREVNSVAFSPDGQKLASGSGDQTIKIWDIPTGKAIATLTGHSIEVRSIAFSPDGQRLASGSSDQTIKIWDIATGKAIATLTGHSSWVRSIAFSPDGQRLASGSSDQTIKIWDIATGKAIATLTEHSSEVISVAFSPDGQKLASGSLDNTIKIWDIATGKAIATLTGHSSSVISVAFSPDGQKLASGSVDNTITIWDIATGKAIATLTGHSSSVISVAFSRDGQKLASGSVDNTIKIWDIATGKAIATLTGHSSSVISVAFSPDGQKLASGSFDNTIKIWDIATGKAIATLTGHSSSVTSVAFSPDGQRLASGSFDNTIILWDLNLDDLLHSGCNLLNYYLIAHPEVLADLPTCQTPSRLQQGATVLVIQGEKLAQNDDINAAIDKFRKAQQWDKSLKFDPQAKAQEFANKGQ
ncbi:ribosome assembly protein 4 [Tolypothrix sp. PCC 7910]|uniref:WD40 domain-containing protein n=1 Tax=Tolypothrix sp. PCC 7910 TaxID=2099387 RepID=UPI0014278CCB|nr:ribosome assembly protein 4 [Tolypothrix sp. PCC 7910]QIR36511.1 ribosome assembly protein 4 [Tolypothrix sp. PCC 7910]